MTYLKSYEKLRQLYSEKEVSYDSLTKGREIENLVESLMREIASPLVLKTDVRIGSSAFDGEIHVGNGDIILYEVLVGRLSTFRYRSLLNLVRSTYFPQKTYILIITRSLSHNDKKSIAALTSETKTYGARFAFVSHKELISLHKFCVKMNEKFKEVKMRKVKKLFLELILGSEQIVKHESFTKYLNLAIKRSSSEPIQSVVIAEPKYLITQTKDSRVYEQIRQLADIIDELVPRMRKLQESIGMLEKNVMPEEEEIYEIDLRAVESSGTFPCPKCRSILSPDDESEENYRITETETADGELSALTLTCNNCKTKIRVVGFLEEKYPVRASRRNIKRIYPSRDESRRSIQAYLKSMR